MDVQLSVSGVDSVESLFARLYQRLDSPKPAFEQLADYLRGRERELFATRGDGRWPPLKRDTVRRKGHARILYKTGRLHASLTTTGVGSVHDATDQELRFGTSLFYARFVSKRRPLFDVRPQDRAEMGVRILRYLFGAQA